MASTDGGQSPPEIPEGDTVPEGFYATLPALDEDEYRNHLPFWITVQAADRTEGARGSSDLHFPAEGSSRDDPEKLCGTSISRKSKLVPKDIPTFPKGFASKCTRCKKQARERRSDG